MNTIKVPKPKIYLPEEERYYVNDTKVDAREKVHEVHIGPVELQDGTTLVQSDIKAAYFLFIKYDLGPSGVVEKIWSSSKKKWDLSANVPEDDRDKNVLLFTEGAAYPWKGPFVLIGEKGKIISVSPPEIFPKYAVQSHFTSRSINNKTYAGKSTQSVSIMMGAFPPQFKARLEIKPVDNINSESITVLHDEVGFVKITKNLNEILISHDITGAKIKLDSFGNISIDPSSGRKVKIPGSIDINGNVNITGSLIVNGNLIT